MLENRIALTKKTYDDNADFFKERHSYVSEAHKSHMSYFLRLLQGNQILDVGCGAGIHASIFSEAGYRVTGIDISLEMLKRATKDANAKFAQADMCQLPFRDSSFDGTWVAASLLHLPKEYAPVAIAEAYRVLKSKGILCLEVKEGKGEKEICDPHRRFYSFYKRDELNHLLGSPGFNLFDISNHKGEDEAWLVAFARK
jgi:ubiquinone/menaquinone biosynthesis C-methylase UbiE